MKAGRDTHRVIKAGFVREHPKTREKTEFKIGGTVAPTKPELNAFVGFFEPVEENKQQEIPPKSAGRNPRHERQETQTPDS